MKKQKVLFSFAVFFFLFFIAAGLWAKDIVIGFTGPLSGPAAEYGQDCANGIDMAVKDLNAAGGVKVKGTKYLFKLEKLDDRSDAKQAVANARLFREKYDSVIVTNPVFNSSSAIMKINQEKGKEFILLAYTSSIKASQLNNKLVVVGAPPFSVYIQIYTDMAWARGWRKCGMLTTTGAYGEEWKNAFKEYWIKKGGKISTEKSSNYYKETDFSKELTEILAGKPDFLLVGGPSSPTALVIEQARRMGYKGGFFLLDQAKMDYVIYVLQSTKLLEDVTGYASASDNITPVALAFNKKYMKTYKRMNTWEASTHYACTFAIAKAIAAANSVDNAVAIRAAFPKALPVLGDKVPSEIYGVTPAGRIHRVVQLQIVKHGKLSKPTLYVWWAKTLAEFNEAKKVTKYSLPLTWLKGIQFE
jgi:branched-chain amino acid transport system substrate-binding protein